LLTLLAACEREIPGTVEGASMLELVANPGGDWRSYIHGEYNGNGVDEHQFVVDDDANKYVWHPQTGEELLFDSAADPRERRNLADRRDPDRMRRRLVEELTGREEGFVVDGALAGREPEP
jgi:arylsulfatase A-like enzyme